MRTRKSDQLTVLNVPVRTYVSHFGCTSRLSLLRSPVSSDLSAKGERQKPPWKNVINTYSRQLIPFTLVRGLIWLSDRGFTLSLVSTYSSVYMSIS